MATPHDHIRWFSELCIGGVPTVDGSAQALATGHAGDGDMVRTTREPGTCMSDRPEAGG